MTRKEAYANKLISRSELINKIYDDFENKSCDGCKYDEKDDTYPTICWECRRYYADRYELMEV